VGRLNLHGSSNPVCIPDTKADALLVALKAATTTGLTRSEMTRDVFQNHVAARELARILGLLQDAELAFSREEDADGPGRPAQRWFIQSRTCERSELIPVERNSFASFAHSQAPAAAMDPANPLRTSADDLTDADIFEVA